jgi:VIT1/CCC1 family predicted Fe2+/Mn2+ transporter
MNEQLKQLAEQASNQNPDGYPVTIPYSKEFVEKFAELLKQAIYNNVKEWLSTDSQIADESDPMVREYLKGYDSGNVDALCEIKNFGVDIDL